MVYSIFPFSPFRIDSNHMIISQAAGNWRKECERILDDFFAQFTVRTQTVDTFDPSQHNNPAVDVRFLSSLKGVLTISVTGRLKDVEQKMHQLEANVNQVNFNSTPFLINFHFHDIIHWITLKDVGGIMLQ